MGWASGEPGFCTPSTTWLAVSAAVAVEGSNYNSETTHKTCISARVHPPQFFVNVRGFIMGKGMPRKWIHNSALFCATGRPVRSWPQRS